MDAENTDKGVAFSFFILPGNYLSIAVSSVKRGKSSTVRDITVKCMYTSTTEGENSDKMELLVIKAVNNLMNSLRTDLAGLYVPSVIIENTPVDTVEVTPLPPLPLSSTPLPPPPPPSSSSSPFNIELESSDSQSVNPETSLPSSSTSSSSPSEPSPVRIQSVSDPTEKDLKSAYQALLKAAETVSTTKKPSSSSSTSSSFSSSPFSSSASSSSSFKNDGKFIDISDSAEVIITHQIYLIHTDHTFSEHPATYLISCPSIR
jgi:hypothetical protein